MASHSGNPFGIPGFPGLPGGDAATNPVLQSMEMMQQMWSQWSTLPGASPVAPVMSPEELDRRIADLRAVENWLNLNLTMLRGTIQGLEVQRATISTLRSFAQTATGQTDAAPEASSGNLWWNMLQDQFKRMAAAATVPGAAPSPKADAKPSAEPKGASKRASRPKADT